MTRGVIHVEFFLPELKDHFNPFTLHQTALNYCSIIAKTPYFSIPINGTN